MKINELKSMTTEEIKERLNSEGSGFLIDQDLAEVVPLLARKKVWTPGIEKDLVKTNAQAELVARLILEEKFVPSVSLATKCLDSSKDEELLVNIVKSLNNYQFPTECLIQASTKKQVRLFITLWTTCTKSREPRLLIPYVMNHSHAEFDELIAEALIAENSRDSSLAKEVTRFLEYKSRFSKKYISALLSCGISARSRGRPALVSRHNVPELFEGSVIDATMLGITDRFNPQSLAYSADVESHLGSYSGFPMVNLLDPNTVPKESRLYPLINASEVEVLEFDGDIISIAIALARNGSLTKYSKNYLLSLLKNGEPSGQFLEAMGALSSKFISGQRGVDLKPENIVKLQEKIELMKGDKKCSALVSRLLPKKSVVAKKFFFAEMLNALYGEGYAAMEVIEKETGYSIEKFVEDSQQATKSVDSLYRSYSIAKAIPVDKLPVFETANRFILNLVARKVSDRKEIPDGVSAKIPLILERVDHNTLAKILSEKALINLFGKEKPWCLLSTIKDRKSRNLPADLIEEFVVKGLSKPAEFLKESYVDLTDLENCGILSVLSKEQIKKVAKAIGYQGASAMVTVVDSVGRLVFGDDEIKPLLLGSTGRIERDLLKAIKKHRKGMFNRIRSAYISKDIAYFESKFVQEREVMEEYFEAEVKEKVSKTNSNPERTNLMNRIRNSKWIEKKDLGLLKQIYEEKPKYFADKELLADHEVLAELRKFTQPKTVTVWRVETLEDLVHFKSERNELSNEELIRAISSGVKVSGSIHYENSMFDSQETLDIFLKYGCLKVTDLKERPLEDITESQFARLAANISRIPLGKIDLERHYGLCDLTRALVNIYSLSLKFKIAVDHPMVRRIEFIHKATGADPEELESVINGLELEESILTGSPIKDVAVPGRYYWEYLISLVETLDPRFKEINLHKMNLENIPSIGAYEDFLESSGMDLEALQKWISIPSSARTNPKTFSSLNTLIAMDGYLILKKAKLLNAIIGSNIDFADAFEVDHAGTATFTEWFDDLDFGSLEKFTQSSGDLVPQIRASLRKGELKKFIASMNDSRDLEDTMELYKGSVQKISDLQQQLAAEKGAEAKEALRMLLIALSEKLEHAFKQTSFIRMHDIFTDVVGSLSGDPLDPTGLEKYNEVTKRATIQTIPPAEENLKDVSDEFGLTPKGLNFFKEQRDLSMFFPKNKADLISLGSYHGWCVDTVGSYYESSFGGRTILVALCEGSPSVEGARVLAEISVIGDAMPELHQLRISSVLGKTTVDAMDLIDRSMLLRVICEIRGEKLDKKVKGKKKAS